MLDNKKEAQALLWHEWGRFDFNTGEADDNLIRLSIISRGDSFYLRSLTNELDGTNINGGSVGTVKEYPLNKTVKQIIDLTADEVLEQYKEADWCKAG